ncbi:thioredoxin domain-containing protein [Streptomyces sp. NPDC001657]|uniref:DsbA family protein n=1 Tax=Streptomyces sp. NPDC001657 TaxID=3154522 RepID=UPI00332D6342
MSQKNEEGKRSARERLQAQREKEQARARRGRQAIVAGAVLVVLAIAGGITAWVMSSGSGGSSSDNETALPKQASGGDRPAVPVGAPNAPATLTVWEDFRCPACQQFETGFRPVIHELQDQGRLKSEYHLVTIIDGNAGGKGSLNAANAALCAQDAGRFRDYHDVLYANQPPEQEDKFADKKVLLQLAGKVKGLTTPAFTACVNDGRYDAFVRRSNDAFARSGYRGTPTVLLNGKDLSKVKGGRMTPADLKQMVLDAAKGKQPGTGAPSAPASPGHGASSGHGASRGHHASPAASAAPGTGAGAAPGSGTHATHGAMAPPSS